LTLHEAIVAADVVVYLLRFNLLVHSVLSWRKERASRLARLDPDTKLPHPDTC